MSEKVLVFEVEKLTQKQGIEKEIIVVDNPITGSFKVSNGKLTAYVYLHDDEVDVFVVDSKGDIKTSTLRV